MLSELSCRCLKGVGEKTADSLTRLGIQTVQDLLFHLPARYQDRSEIIPISELQAGDTVAIKGYLQHCRVSHGRRKILHCLVSSDEAQITLRFFNFSNQLLRFLSEKEGKEIQCYGEIRAGREGLEMVHPEYTFSSDEDFQKKTTTEETLTPIYPTTKGLNQQVFRKLTEQALILLKGEDRLQDHFPIPLIEELKLSNIQQAISILHRPPLQAKEIETSQNRLAFEELVAHQLSLRKMRKKAQHHSAISLVSSGKYQTDFLSQLPFELTQAQQRVNQEIQLDLEKNVPMMRLVQGDVGSGKTVVAALAILKAIENGYQTALMAPTELLAEQHVQNFKHWFEPLGIQITRLTGSLKAKEKRNVLEDIALGNAQVVIGTHALFQDYVQFKSLTLLVVDEQHRFGVHQRLALREKGCNENCLPHQLIMTATPIPRTLAMTAYADLDYSVIDELPKGRKPVSTIVLSDTRREDVLERIQENCQQGRQVYWVCTLIEESEALQCEAAEDTYKNLQSSLNNLSIALVHGRMKAPEKEHIMQCFKQGEIDVLVATTVIEVGVDVPNASLMVIENAERLGLAQLHQLRGRVGRGDIQSYCVLLYKSPLSKLSKERLAMMRESNDGFLIAQKDLELRGPGEVLGVRQAGFLRFKIADLMRDNHLLSQVRYAADILLDKHPVQAEALIERWHRYTVSPL